jgi:hypothetical protein
MGIIKWRCEIPNGSTQEYLCKYIYERRLFVCFVCHVEIFPNHGASCCTFGLVGKCKTMDPTTKVLAQRGLLGRSK